MLHPEYLYKLNLGKFVFQSVTGNIPESLQNIIVLNNTIHNYETRSANSPHLFEFKSSIMKNSYIVQSIVLWLKLSSDVTSCRNLSVFAKKLKAYLLHSDL